MADYSFLAYDQCVGPLVGGRQFNSIVTGDWEYYYPGSGVLMVGAGIAVHFLLFRSPSVNCGKRVFVAKHVALSAGVGTDMSISTDAFGGMVFDALPFRTFSQVPFSMNDLNANPGSIQTAGIGLLSIGVSVLSIRAFGVLPPRQLFDIRVGAGSPTMDPRNLSQRRPKNPSGGGRTGKVVGANIGSGVGIWDVVGSYQR